jgi:hypothetical protein
MVLRSNLHGPPTAQVWSWIRGERISTGPAALACSGVEEAVTGSSSVMQRSTHDSLFLVVNIFGFVAAQCGRRALAIFPPQLCSFLSYLQPNIFLIGEIQQPLPP